MKAREVIAKTFVPGWQQHIAADGADAILDELAKNGFAIVPIEPNEKMIEAASEVLFRPEYDGVETKTLLPPVYRAMLKAAEGE